MCVKGGLSPQTTQTMMVASSLFDKLLRLKKYRHSTILLIIKNHGVAIRKEIFVDWLI